VCSRATPGGSPPQWEHAEQIRRAYGYRDFSDPAVQADLTGWLAARARTSADRAGVLFDLATARLIEAKVLLPGPSLLERLVATARESAAQQLHVELAALPDEQQRRRLAGLLTVDEATRTSRLERLRRGPTSVTGAGLLGALGRLAEVRQLGVGELDLSGLPAGRVATLARHAQAARAQALARMAEPRRTASLLAAARQLQTDATDDLLDLLDRLLAGLLSRSQRAEQRERLRALPAFDVAARSLRDAVDVLLDPPDAGRGGLPAVCAALEQRGMSRAQLAEAVEAVNELSRQPESWVEQLLTRYPHVRRFLPTLLDGLQLSATAGGQPVLTALDALRDLEGRRRGQADEVPLELATGVWQRLVTAPTGSSTAAPTPSACSSGSRTRCAAGTSSPRPALGGPTPAPGCSPARPGKPPAARSAAALATTPPRTASWPSWLTSSTPLTARSPPDCPATPQCEWKRSRAETSRCSRRWTASTSRQACSPCVSRSPPCCRGWTFPTCCSRSPAGPASRPSSPMCPKAPVAPRTCTCRCAAYSSPKPATSASNRWSSPASRR